MVPLLYQKHHKDGDTQNHDISVLIDIAAYAFPVGPEQTRKNGQEINQYRNAEGSVAPGTAENTICHKNLWIINLQRDDPGKYITVLNPKDCLASLQGGKPDYNDIVPGLHTVYGNNLLILFHPDPIVLQAVILQIGLVMDCQGSAHQHENHGGQNQKRQRKDQIKLFIHTVTC